MARLELIALHEEGGIPGNVAEDGVEAGGSIQVPLLHEVCKASIVVERDVGACTDNS